MVTAWNDDGISVNQSGIVQVVYPVQRHQYSLIVNATDLVPYEYPKTGLYDKRLLK